MRQTPAEKRTRQMPRAPKLGAPRPESSTVLWIALSLTIATLLVYARVWTNEFVDFDDFNYISRNPDLARGVTAHAIAWAFTTGYEANWHPLTWLSHMIDIELYGLRPGPHHFTNVVLHVANSLLLFVVLHRMTKTLWRSALVAGLFALHPLHVESVAWAAERKDVLSTLFWMLTLWMYVAYVRDRRRWRYLTALGLFALGLMAKPMLVNLPFVLLLLDYWPLGRVSSATGLPGRPRAIDPRGVFGLVREKLPFFALAVASSVVTFIVQQRGGTVNWTPLSQRLVNALMSYVSYIAMTFWPTRLAVMYTYPQSLPAWWIIATMLVGLLGVSIAVMIAARRYPYLPVGWLWYLGTLVPVIGLVQVGNQAMADRYTYVPLIGLFIMLAWGIGDLTIRWSSRQVALTIAGGAVLVALAALTAIQVGYWKNSLTLWMHAAEATQRNYLAHWSIGNVLVSQGRAQDAVPHFEEALRVRPDFIGARNNLGYALASVGRYDEAIAYYREAIDTLPTYVEARNNLALALASQGKLDDAVREMQEAVRIKPDDAESHFNLAAFFSRRGQLDEAVRHYRESLRLRPASADAHYRLGGVLVDQGKVEEAAQHFQLAVSLDPGSQRARRALNDLRNRRSASPSSTR